MINGSATIIISGLNCLEAYTVTAGGTLDGTLVGPRSSHEPITTGVCMPTVAPTTSSMIGKSFVKLYIIIFLMCVRSYVRSYGTCNNLKYLSCNTLLAS